MIELYTCMPEVPEELCNEDMFNEYCDRMVKLWNAVLEELMQQDFLGRAHHNCGTYDKGCRGPLCRKALRDHPRRRTQDGYYFFSPREDRALDSILEYFHTVGKHRILTWQRRLHRELVAG